jgi:uncharacterized membrane protein YuzA (DUF378 family)
MMKKCMCAPAKISGLLVFVGGLNWGLVGAGMLFGSMHDMSWNLVHMLLGRWMWAEAVVYLIVGVAAIAMLFGCKCSKCASCCVAESGSAKM